MKILLFIFLMLYTIAGHCCNSFVNCDIGESCYNYNTLQEYSGFDNAGICLNIFKVNSAKRARENNEQGCCADHGGIYQLDPNKGIHGMSVMCYDMTYSPTCTWK